MSSFSTYAEIGLEDLHSGLSRTDIALAQRTLELAARGAGRVSPNPLVGALVWRDGEILGEGWHDELGGPHAEINAIRACGDIDLDGSTLFVSLEPCAHHGRTPPCTDAVIGRGIRRVVAVSSDPNDVTGTGRAQLEANGVRFHLCGGQVAERARHQNQPFRKHVQTGQPWVVLKAAMSLDGRVATRTGDSRWISGEASRELVHRWRAEFDAIAVGIGTAIADDPLLTARTESRGRPCLRVVFDARATLSLKSQLVRTAREWPLLVVVGADAPEAALCALRGAGAEVLMVEGDTPIARLDGALAALGELGITSVLLEGGPRLAAAFLEAGALDELRLFVAPLLVGDGQARGLIEGPTLERISHAVRARSIEAVPVGGDVLLTTSLRQW